MLTTQNHGVKNGVDRKCVHQSFYTVPKPKEGKAEMGAGRGRHEGRGKKRVRWWVKASVKESSLWSGWVKHIPSHRRDSECTIRYDTRCYFSECRRGQVYPLRPHLHTTHAYHFIPSHTLVDLQFLLVPSKVNNKLLIGPVFIQPTFEGINRISLYHIIRQTAPNINDPVTKRIFPYVGVLSEGRNGLIRFWHGGFYRPVQRCTVLRKFMYNL